MVNPYGERTITIASAAFIILTLVSTAHAPPSPPIRLFRSVSDKVMRTFSSGSNLLKRRYSARWEQPQQLREPCLRDCPFGGGYLIVGKDGTLFFALDEKWVVHMEVVDAKKKQATFRRDSVDSSWGGTLVKSLDYFPFGGSKGIALATVFEDRIVPYHKGCNQAHYMAYFTHGEVRNVQGRSTLSKDCPLHRTDFDQLRSYEITTNTFYLLKGDKSPVYPASDFPSAPRPIPSNPPLPPSSPFTGVGQPRPTSPSRRTNVPESSTIRHRRSVSDPTMGRTSTYSRFKN